VEGLQIGFLCFRHCGMALVHFQTEREIAPNPKLLCHVRLATDRIRVSGRQHPVQHRHADGGLGPLSRKVAGPKPSSDQHFLATHRCFYQRTSTVVVENLPRQSPLFRDHLQMVITLCRRTCFAARHRRRAQRDHHFDIIATHRDRLVGRIAIICAIGRHAGNPSVNLIQ
jgi:hypothetical protein